MGWMPTYQGILDSVVADFIIRLSGFVLAYLFAERMRMQYYLSLPAVLLVGVAAYGIVTFAWNQAVIRGRAQDVAVKLSPLPGYDISIPARSSREGEEEGFKKATVVWFASIAGARISQLPIEDRKKVARALFIEPNSEFMKIVAQVQGDRGKDFPEIVRQSVRFCKGEQVKKEKKGSVIEVRLSSSPLLNVTLFDPGTPHAWARIQELIPYYRGPESLVYAIRKEDQEKLYNAIEDSFTQAWKEGRDPLDIN